MKSVKLTNSIREGIIKQLMKLPREKYPKLIDKKESIPFNSLSTDKDIIYKSIPVSKWYRCYNDEILNLLRKNEKIQNFCKQLIFSDKELKTLENKLSCLLHHVNTTKQLKDQFPEAYKIFLELNDEVEDNSDNLCDSFENIRASLSKFNKK